MLRSAIVLLLFGSACSGDVCPAQRFTDPSRALAAYRSMRAPARVMRGEARVDRRDGSGRIRGDVLMYIERPDHVRFDAMTQLGPAAILTSDGQTFALTDLRENRFFVGPTCPANIERLIGLPLAGDQVTLLLLGETPIITASSKSIECNGGRYNIQLRAADGTSQGIDLEVRQADAGEPPELQRMRLRATEVRHPNGELEWRVEWDDYRFIEDPRSEASPRMGVMMPFRIRFEHPSRGIDTLVRFERIDLNADPPSEAFVQEPRPGLEVETVYCE